MAAGDSYFGGPKTEQPGTPPKEGGNALTSKMGPLPVWGWGVVAVAAVFLYRKIAGGANAGKQQPGVNYPQGGVGGVFLLPQGGQGAPAPTPKPTTAPGAPQPPVTPDVLRSIGHSLIEFNNTVFPQQLSPEGQTFLHNVASSPNPGQTEDFLTQNVARKALGLPYIVGAGSWGNAGVLDPATGHVTPLAQ